MPILYEDSIARFTGVCTVEEAMEVQDWLRRTKTAKVDLAACEHLHTAILQVLMAARPAVSAPPDGPFLARWVLPLFA